VRTSALGLYARRRKGDLSQQMNMQILSLPMWVSTRLPGRARSRRSCKSCNEARGLLELFVAQRWATAALIFPLLGLRITSEHQAGVAFKRFTEWADIEASVNLRG